MFFSVTHLFLSWILGCLGLLCLGVASESPLKPRKLFCSLRLSHWWGFVFVHLTYVLEIICGWKWSACYSYFYLMNDFCFPFLVLFTAPPPQTSHSCVAVRWVGEHFEAPRGLLLLIRPICTDCFVSVTSLLVTLYLVSKKQNPILSSF